ncbi:PREDICTED: F-box/kelch-repeat protein At2g22030-like [Camelina sativa]|uniref:F-box/kelch-repeat protein At2g22030-like n=1 Tax=Camelina sativa TaxID=90675 RepID=A0ABM0TUC0_CAMSA|nr:PREDICTED: F-box/kelch-repeat protein At2g22030-like [Camelina sativa]
MRRAGKLVNGNPKPYEIVSYDQSSLSFWSLPYDVVLNCLVRVPRCYYPNLSCVCKRFRSLVRSPEFAHMRSLMAKNYPIFCVCFTEPTSIGRNFHWFTFDTQEKKRSVLKSFPHFPRQMLCCSIVSVGSTIYFIGGSMGHYSPSIRLLDPWSGELCEGPSMKEPRNLPGVTVVDGKLYVTGGCRKDQIQVEVFDPTTQTWEVGPLSPHGKIQYGERLVDPYGEVVTESVAVEGKVYGMSYNKRAHIIYDTKDGRCDTFDLANERAWTRGGVCVINNVIYVYYKEFGLMWYDSIGKEWRVVSDLTLDKSISMPVGMVDCNGKLAFLWEDLGDIFSPKKKNIWCTIIVLSRCGSGMRGTVKRSDLVGTVPIYYDTWRCLDVSDPNFKGDGNDVTL